MATGTIRLHRVLRASPEHVYRAFVERWALPDTHARGLGRLRESTAVAGEGAGLCRPGERGGAAVCECKDFEFLSF